MAVKELYSELDQIIGHAVMLRNDDGWLYYCIAEEAGRCFSSSQPNAAHYSKATTSCSCHGLGTIVSVDSIPPP
jgi:hypothetical protein